MKTCAVITAAGLSSRMGAFKPALPIAGRPAILRLLDTFFSAGVSEAIVVTGFRQEILQELLADRPHVTLVHNPAYRTTEMFDSVKTGLAALPEDCGQVLLIPADIPLVSAQTVRLVMEAEGDLVFPSFQMRRGHPLKLRPHLVPALLQYSGEDGLRGALRALEIPPAYVTVEDSFILRDMDTPADYQALAGVKRDGSL